MTRLAEISPRNPQVRASSPALITACFRGRGARSIRPGSAGSRDSASAGRVSVPRSIARICITVSGQFGAVDHPHPPGAEAHPAGDGGRGQPVVPGDHVHPDAGPVHPLDRRGDLRPGRVEHRHQPGQAQVALGVLAPGGTPDPVGRSRCAIASTRSPRLA